MANVQTKIRHQIKWSETLIYVILAVGSISMVFPFIWMILSSFKLNGEVTAYPPTVFPKVPTVANYIEVWTEIKFSKFFVNSLFVTILKTSIILYTSALVGYVLNKIEFKGKNIIFAFILATMMIPWPVTIIPMYQVMVWFGWINSYNSLIWTGVFNSFGIFMMRQFVGTIPTSIVESGRIDGASEFGIFHRLVMPLLGAGVSALGIFIFLGTWDDFLWPYLMLSDEALYTLPVGLALFNGQFYNNYAGLLAGATITVIPVLILYLIFQNQFIEGIALTGSKE